MIEVFKTNIKNKKEARFLLHQLQSRFPNSMINIDLEDCDKVLRIETPDQKFDEWEIVEIFRLNNFNCQLLDY